MTGISNIGNNSSMSMSAMREKMFSKMDNDGDGLLSKSEMEAAMEKRKAEGSDSQKTEKGKGPNLDDMFSELDSDGDGMLSMTEMEQMKPPSGPPPGGRRAEDGLSGETLNVQSFSQEYLEQKIIEQYASDNSDSTNLLGISDDSTGDALYL